MKELRFLASKSSGEVSALVIKPKGPKWLLVLGHGAGAGMRHPFMAQVAEDLAEHGIATFRYQFPYIEQGRKAPNPAPILMATVRSAVEAAKKALPGVPVLAGGKSMGGRMTSSAAAKEPLEGVRGIVFFGFPLHAPGKASSDRAAHLFDVQVPMLFLQGTRDNLANLDHLRPVCKKLGKKATMHIIEGGDHSFNVPKKLGRSKEEVYEELAKSVAEWASALR